MCPNIRKPQFKRCPGRPGTLHPYETDCDFVNIWRNGKGQAVFVACSRKGYFTSYVFSRKSVVLPLAAGKSLPYRRSFDAAQTDLNLYAQKKGWKLA
jgi:hypothetical protein